MADVQSGAVGAPEETSSVEALKARISALESAQAMARSVLEGVPAVVMRLSLDGTIEFINRVLPEYAGQPPVGQPIYAFAPADQHAVMRGALEEAIRTQGIARFESIAQAPDGTRDWYATTVGPIFEGGRLTGLTMISLNTSRERETEAALGESRARLALALDAGNVGVWRWDARSDVVEWDLKLAAMFGLPAAGAPRNFKQFLEVISADQRQAMRRHIEEALSTGLYSDFELRADLPTGPRWFIAKGGPLLDENGKVVGLLGGVVDNTERRRLEEQVRRAHRLEAVGQLSAGVAHNFNNMLAVVVPVLELAKQGASGETVVALEDALGSALRAAQLVKQLMVFSRTRPVDDSRREPLSECVKRAVELCRRTFDRRITLEVGGLEAAAEVGVDGGAVEQAVLNLLLNARDALEGLDGERARIEVTVRRLSAAELRRRLPEAHGEHVEVRVRDTGAGMDEATQRRVFDPFFTTKPVGQGTGLGLPTAWATAQAHGGALECESALGAGTTFALVLPVRGLPPAAQHHGGETPAPWGRVVLLIEDEALVRNATAAMLSASGYRVLPAASGEEGVRLAAGQPVDVVLMDYSMPGQAPATTLAQLRAARPRLPVVCFTGLGVALEGADAHLTKPVTRDELVAALERVAR